jgi:GAF domain-containing protein/HAMP domain-containing protein
VKEDQVTVIDEVINSEDRKGRITRIASLLGILVFALLAAGFLGFYLLSVRLPIRLAGGLLFSAAFLASLAAYFLQRKKKYDLANWILLGTLLTIGVGPSFIYSGTGLLGALASLLLAVLLASAVLQDRQIIVFFWIGLSSVLVAQFADTFGSPSRTMMMQPVAATSASIIMAVVLIVVLVWRFQSYPFRAKIIVSLWGLTASVILVIAAVSAFISSQSLTQQGFTSLASAAKLVAETIDQFVSNNLSNLEAEAQLPDLRAILSSPRPSTAMREGVETVMQNLSMKGKLAKSETNYHGFLQAYLLVDPHGQVVYDTSDPQSKLDASGADYYLHSIQSEVPYISPVYFVDQTQAVIYFSAQIQDQSGKPAGVLAARYDAAVLQHFLIKNNNLVVDQSFAYLVDENGLCLAQGSAAGSLFKPILPMEVSIVEALNQQNRLPTGSEPSMASEIPDLARQLQLKAGSSNLTYRSGKNSEGPYYFAATDFLQTQPWTVIYSAPQAVLMSPIMKQVQVIQLLGVAILVVALAVAYFLSRFLIIPVINMTETAFAISGGNFAARANVQSQDEIGTLSKAVNELADRMQVSLQDMERQIDDRTQDLVRRTGQLQAAAEIGRAVSTIHNINDLLERSAYLIGERFNFYHVGIFMVEETGRFAILRAANSEGGKRMLARSHRLAVGQQGIVGYVTSTGRSRIALDVGADAVFFNNPDLPSTRSELALPLVSGERILGALDVQSEQPGAFTNEDITVLQVLADFLAVALENARLFLESQSSLETIRHAYGELSERSWVDRLSNIGGIGFRSLDQGVYSLADAPLFPESDAGQKLSIPIRVRETLIGYVDAYKPTMRGEWSKEELDTVDALVDQLGVALESARLFENTQLLAERERLVSAFNTRLQESLDVDAVLRTAVSEMRRILGSKHVTLVLGKGKDS